MSELKSICFDSDKISVVIILKQENMNGYEATVEAIKLIKTG